MEILGYSERGAMNALFYGIAIAKDLKAANTFVSMSGIKEQYADFDFYIECSLSEFGSPDLVIIAKKTNGKLEAIFVEAKVSCGNEFNIQKVKDEHDEYISGSVYKKGRASNLFFQLRLKDYFFRKTHGKDISRIPQLIQNSGNHKRSNGKNEIVLKLADIIKQCSEAKYIALIPEQNDDYPCTSKYGFDTHFVAWEDVCGNSELKGYIDNTIKFNEVSNSQITNKKK